MRVFGLGFVLGGLALAVYTWRLTPGSHTDSDMVFRGTMCAVIAGIGIILMLLGDGRIRTRDDWAQGFARPEATSQAKTWILVGTLLLLLSAPLALQLRTEVVTRRNYAALVALVFPIVGLLMVSNSVVAWLRHRKFANLRLVGIPAVLGGKLAGRIEGEFRLPAGAEVDLVLSCVHSYVSGSGTDRPRWQRVLWQDKRTITAFDIASIPVEFEIPYDARETDSQNPDDEILWRLAASSSLPGLDFRCEFQAPVHKTASSDPTLTIAVLEAKTQSRHKPADSMIASGPGSGGGVRFHLAAARHKGIAATLTVFGILCLGSGLFFGYGLWKALTWVLGLIPVVIFCGMGLLLLAIAFGMWFGATTVEVVNRELHVRSTYIVFSSSRILSREAIESFELHNGMQRGDEVWYDLRVRLKNGRRWTICSGMAKDEAEWFLGEIKKDMGI